VEDTRGRRGSGLLGGDGGRPRRSLPAAAAAAATSRRLSRRAARWWARTRRRPPTAVLADAAGVTMVRVFLARLSDTFGWSFIALLFSAYLGVKGSLMQLTTSAQLPYFKKNLGITGTEYQAYGTAAMTPWAMKALIGTISDAVPLGGYHKRNYILLAAVGGSVAYTLLATLKIVPSAAALAAFLLFCAQLELATVDLLVEGTYARVGGVARRGCIGGWAWAVGVGTAGVSAARVWRAGLASSVSHGGPLPSRTDMVCGAYCRSPVRFVSPFYRCPSLMCHPLPALRPSASPSLPLA